MLYPASTLLRRDPLALVRPSVGDLVRETRAFPAINIWQSQDTLTITAEVPGVDPKDMDLSVKDNVLTLSGKREAEDLGEKVVWRQRERTFGSFGRAIRAPFNVDPEKTEASVTNGVLEITLHRREEDKPRRIEVKAA